MRQDESNPSSTSSKTCLKSWSSFWRPWGRATGKARQDAEKSHAESAQRALEETIRLVMQLRQLSVNAQINQLRFLQADPENPPDQKDLTALLNNLNQLIKLRGVLDKALSTPILQP